MPIDWDKIESKPVEKYKIAGVDILNLKSKLDHQEKSMVDLQKSMAELTGKMDKQIAENKQKDEKISSLEAEIQEQNGKIASLESEATEKVGSLEKNTSELKKSVSTKEAESSKLKAEVSTKSTKITDLEKQVTELKKQVTESQKTHSQLQEQAKAKEAESEDMRNQLEELLKNLKTSENTLKEREEEIASLNAKIEELKEQIPKKPVYEEAEETVKGAQCPKCGWPIREEYKMVDRRRHLIRKYCPNTFCMWTSSEEPKVIIATGEAPQEEEKVVKIFRVRGSDIEEADGLESKMVAIIADPAKNIVWIWKGKESSRFEYAEATGLANKVKKVVKTYGARIERAEEENEPENFPKF